MRKLAREVAFKLIYQNLFGGDDELSFELLKAEEKLNEEEEKFSSQIFEAFEKNREEVEELVRDSVEGYELSRIYKVDLALLYLALTEIKFIKTPVAVAINEALELSKKYSTDKSQSFINGVLKKIV